jgi:ribosomal protein S10
MYGKLPKNKVTGMHYQIPSLNQIMDIIKDKQKTVEQIMNILIPVEIGLRD